MIALPLAAFTAVFLWDGPPPADAATAFAPTVRASLPRGWDTKPGDLDRQQPIAVSGGGDTMATHFGLCHGMGLATKLQALAMSKNGLLTNLIGFNIGVEVGQVIVLFLVVSLLNLWRGTPSFRKGAYWANMLLILGGIALTVHQLQGYFAS